jgi:hypothetical protein
MAALGKLKFTASALWEGPSMEAGRPGMAVIQGTGRFCLEHFEELGSRVFLCSQSVKEAEK